jgi:hypothetical protein
MANRLVFLACLLVAGVCNADTIGTIPIPPDLTLSGFGDSDFYRGETFHLPPGPAALANSLTVFVGPTNDFGASFHVLVTDVDTSTGFHPTSAIFELALARGASCRAMRRSVTKEPGLSERIRTNTNR